MATALKGGGDCPEMSIGAIKIALEISLPGSFIYVFTDARSKDYRLTHEVLQLIQQKQSQVVFVLTGDCDDRTHIGYKVYEEIASTSSGQVFHLDKKQVNEVLKWVEEAVQASKVHLLSTDHLEQAVNTWRIPFDPSLKEVTVSLSGPSPMIEIRSPLGKLIKKGFGLHELLNIHNSAKVVNVKEPEAGMWTVKTSSSGRHSVRITGLSTIDFRAGFSRKPTLDFKKTVSRPVQGIPTYVLLNTSGISTPARIDLLELLSISGSSLKTIPVKYYPDRKPYGIWNISDFVPPNEAFFLKVTGYDKDDYLFQRVSSVSFSNIVPDAPKVTMPEKTPGYYLQPGQIPCSVDSLLPFTLSFVRNGVTLGVDQYLKESASVNLDIEKVILSDEGFYECIAVSSAGTGRAQTFFDVSEPPPVIQVPNNVTVTPGERAVLTCLIISAVDYNLTWQRNDRDVRLAEPARIRTLANLSLELTSVKFNDAGEYHCMVSSEGGSSAASVFLTVQEPPKVTVMPKNQSFTGGSEVSVMCSATGYPKPKIAWTVNDMFIVGSHRYRMTSDGTLFIKNAAPKDAGIYGCLASNSAGTDKQNSTLRYIEAPKLMVVQSELLVALGDITVMECKTSGIPPPQVKWFKGDLELRPSTFLIIDPLLGLLKIQETQDLDAGDYTCVAINEAGRATGKITLDVGSPPVFIQEPADVSMEIGSNVTLPCYVQGYPEPTVKWRRLDNMPIFSRPFSVSSISQLRTGALFILNLWASDKGTYICEAENQFGKIQSETTVTVTGLVAPLIGISPSVANVIEGQQLTLPCTLLAGNPIPERRWIKNSAMLLQNPYITVRSDGSLHIERVQLQDGGEYTCVASNVAGTNNKTTSVVVHVLPTIQHGQQILSTIEGIPVTLPCKASGIPKPSVIWSKKGELISTSGAKFSAGADGSLYVVSPGGEESGEYVCTATNAAGYAKRKVQLTVYVRPRVFGDQRGLSQDKPVEISVLAGEEVTLPCEVKSLPPPIITWAKETQLISPFSPRHTFLPSGSMKITETRTSDSGMYLCVATNIAGNVTQAVKLNVHVPPKIQRGPKHLKVQVGQRVDIPCNAQGTPLPVITWSKGGSTMLVDGEHHVSNPDGTLSIDQATPSDAGIYTCVATNIAGTDETEITLHVQEPPTVEDLEPPYNTPFQERVANQRIAFPCPAKGTPKPTIKWLHNGRELTGREPGISILEDDTLLVIASVTPYDNGEYICVAVNEAGTTERKYNLKVHVPPVIKDKEQVTNVSVLLNQLTNLFCEVEGTPSPIIMWYKDNVQVTESSTIQIVNNGKILKLFKATPEDAGRYSCKAINIAGTSQKYFNIDVLVPPTIIGTNFPNEVSVVLNRDVALECQVKGTPFPDIHWFKDGKPLFLGDPNVELLDRGQVLHLKNARRNDKGRYQCTVSNAAGKQAKDIKLTIYIPPSIKGGNVTTDISVLINSLIKLECETRGLPMPAITWYKDGQPIMSSSQALYIDKGQYLHIPRAQVSDSATYTCHVANVVGTAEKSFHVDVYVPPMIEGNLAMPLNKQVVIAHSLTLECKAAGNPSPILTWLKDGVPVKANDNIRIEAGGKKLEILNAQEIDRGQYICVATSVAGEKEIKYEVDVLVPPAIEGGDETSYFIVMVNNLLELDCHVTGSPPPTIMWLKDGQLIDERDGFKILLNGRKLVIAQAQVSDTGLYWCMAANTAGDHKKEFEVTVHVPPTIKSSGLSERVVVKYKPVALQCIANGIPNPSITWLKDDQPVNTAQGNLKIQSSGRVLQIAKTLLEDAGRYTCVATNAAGETQQHIQLHVHEPPSLEDAGKMLNETVLVSNPVQLECKAAGNPVPVITWYKDNRLLSGSTSMTFLNRGQIIDIESAQISDAGIYKCVAINSAGATELFYSLQVHVAPSISGSNNMVAVVVNNPVRLECEARGIPAPSLTWLKDGSPVSSFSNGLQVLSGGRILALTSAQISDTGRYTCVAVNAAGEKQRDIDLRVYVPPNIMGEEQNVSVLISQAVELLCQSDAIPPPTLTWLKDGHPLLKKPGLSISENGSVLKIEDAQVQDTGRYTCEATNVAGKTEKNYNVNIWVPPNIGGSDELTQLTVIEGNLISLLCESSGIPPPNLIWKKKGSPVLTDSMGRVRILSGGRQLQISVAEKSDAALYSCVASNVAGTAKKEYNLQVYIRPTITNSGSHPTEIIVTRGKSISLECEVQGIPPPTVTWMKDGRPLIKAKGVEILDEGHILQLKNIHVSDTGRYVCVAVNVAGMTDKKYDLSVHAPPSIIGNHRSPENISVVEKNSVSLTCEASGIPLPSITWFKDGWPVSLSNSVRILSGGRMLRLMQTTMEDAGQYTCVVRNAAGEERKIFGLSVLVPPHIVGENTLEDVKVKEKQSVTLTCEVTVSPTIAGVGSDGNPEDVTVILNSPTSLVCEAYSYPPATITWFKDGTPLESNRNIRILPVPPSFQKLWEIGNMLDTGRNGEAKDVIINNPISLYCETNAAPPPTLTWYKDGHPLTSSDKVLILPVPPSVIGPKSENLTVVVNNFISLTCEVSGFPPPDLSWLKNEQPIKLNTNTLIVPVPPSIEGPEREVIVETISNPVTLTCDATGIPPPTIAWLKNHKRIENSDSLEVHILSGGSKLQIARSQLSDSGNYTCIASNMEGKAQKYYFLSIQVPPSVAGAEIPSDVSVLLGENVELVCNANGIPTPLIQWLKDGKPIASGETERIRVSANGSTLNIYGALTSDTGKYTCVATNPAGEEDRIFNLNVYVPPNIAGTDEPQDITVLRNRQVTLECKSDAVPPPVITWLRNGERLQATPRVRILSGGRYLQINNADLGDTANYTCVASNIAGKTTREFILTVNVPPNIKGGPQSLVILLNKSTVLECIAEGVPTPRITWRKDGAVLAGNHARYSILENGFLHIQSAHVTDTGRYLCMATNAAGTDRRRIDLQVHVPPSIAPGPTNMTVIVNVQTTLACEATGIPKPSINWRKNGHLLNVDQNQNSYRLLSSGSLVIISPSVDDTATYECTVTNGAGDDKRTVDLTVQGAIEILATQLNHAGRYTCVARNAAGSAHRHVTLHVHEPPVIQPQPSELHVILNNPILLPCEATGTPSPFITWQKEGINVNTSGRNHAVLPSGGLQISRAVREDAGTYMCVAQNPAGTALGKIKLNVQVPPVINPHLKEYVIAVDKPITLSCEADGLPPPDITWHKDGRAIVESIRQRVLSSGSLQIAFVQPGDAGHYTCMAANVAGSSSTSTKLTVHVPPRIRSTEGHYTVNENSQAILPCVADGIPTPAINWKKDNVLLANLLGKYTAEPYGELILENVVLEDSGFYTCVANNAAGEDTHTVSLTVHVLPTFTELPGDVSLNKGEQLRLSCKATGIPLPKLTWTFNNNIIPAHFDSVNGHSELVIERVSKEDSGTYVCTAENSVGFVKAIGFVYVKEPPVFKGDYPSNWIEPLGGNAILNCEVKGDPTPTIQWNRKGVDIEISHRIRQLGNGSLAIYGTVNEDAGDYTCVATNEAGVVERSMSLTLQSPPIITLEPVETVINAGGKIILNCQATGEPQPTITWSRQGHSISWDDRVNVLSNNSLYIADAQKEDTSEFECVARNLMGSVLVRVPVIVQVHGGFSQWSAWRACSVTCGKGIQKRSRLCNQPLPANGGKPCQGSDLEMRNCQNKPCPVDGSWSEWSLWEECTRSCGRGNRTRTRTCNNPSVQHGGRPCEGNAVEIIMCNIRPCPVHGAWSAWQPWGTCSESCGKGTQTRARLCNNPPPAFGGSYCDGAETQMQVCNERHCPIHGKWATWASWSACSVSCGGGARQRTRDCSDPVPQYGGRKCEGSDVQSDFCNSDPCPTHGNWSPWSGWGTCSRTCNGGQMRRYRTCDNPPPSNGGRACGGPDSQIQRCNTDMCPVDGSWGSWHSWSQCSASCGGGEKTRKRLCDHPVPIKGGRPCPGDTTQVTRCNVQACPGGPQRARGSVIGNINDVEFGIAFLNATITDSPNSDTRIIRAKITNVPHSLGSAMRKIVSILNPIYWTTAKEIGEAVNGFTLTNAVFKRETQVEFATGEILQMSHIARGLDSDGALLLDIVVSGYVLQLQSPAEVTVKDYTEDYIQTGPGQLYAYSTRLFTIDGISIPYTWNHTVFYDQAQGRMPFLVETLHASSVESDYNQIEETLGFKIHASISKGDRSNQCPSGFTLDSVGPFCADEDECAAGNPCSHTCHNAMGTYYCSCPKGLTIAADGRTCQDIDECALGRHTCHAGQDCDNTIGSYRCVVRCGSGFRRTSDGLSCQDINECQESSPCHQRCFNAIGSFHCGCEPGYQLKGRKCMDVNECRQNVCRPDQHCKNTRGGYKCIDLCPNGMTKAENGTCIDIDECKDGTHQCRYNQICENTRGSYRCVCPRGYRSQGVGRPCMDINECEQVPKPCAHQCSNTPGSFKCICPPGQHLLGDGKSCAGLERLPNYGTQYSSYNLARFSPVRNNYQPQQHYRQYSHLYSSYSEYRNSRTSLSRTRRTIRKTCPEGSEASHDTCIDIDECENTDACQHECKNTFGSYQCICPPGYQLTHNGKTCQDIDECLEQNVHCGPNRMCFNMRGSYQCIDTPCPPNYQRDPVSGFCLKNCPPNDLECALSPYALEYKLVSLPFGIATNQDLIRLVAYTQDGVMHPRTTFLMVDEEQTVPFALRDENLKGVVYTTRPLREAETYRMRVRASSYSANGTIEYQTTFIVYIAVSAYPY
ncbi:HMCN1 isoform 2 [Pan troglodytes]|uniref:Hemicentin-1 n=1 Tax=Pan troglodytes TaxID=9598 RepID=A0A2J8N6C6_PANTR|nr:HMCN1 isoform 2 [Pan troglodytes]